ncbi:MAG: Penicillin-binding protein, 1A family [Candidatus Wolfebacteria bacterium GW2011_GWC1_43_10]|uniref:Penicillin-binding protein, 1A family n=1 Tax=Candidatus Wolfebacteria bacterium GW2011_GWC1_43_10 TaxID=1619011 RepID=A0A0G1F6N8_9BACT|nr:MAG: Penicillin-binding protein, 1A family [Candidatus Wolfebacteria bacterium GW2011_GWC1_43_10]KKT23128.1 MAG: Penicillin-binding protein, 1A family [Parcubacteria group bacterium GW2011_GWB1_43_8b]
MKRITFLFLIVVLVLGVWGGWELIQIIKELPQPEKIDYFQPVQSTKIYDRTGEILLWEIHGEQNRTVVPSEEIPDYAKKATVAIEDQNFYSHSALDVKAIFRAFFKNLIKGNFSQGGSTITQQLVKNVFLTPEKTIKRKIKEVILSYWIERNYSKDQILTQYLNQIPYGSNAYGIESASKMFLGKKTKDLTIAESAALAALIQSPSYYSPWGSHLEEFLSRKDYVLRQMDVLGFIDKQQLDQALQEKISFLSQNIGSLRAPHFTMMVREYLINKYGEDMVENGGLKVITTLDWKFQEKAEAAVTEGVKRNQELYKGNNAALVVQDPKTGQVLALVGSANYSDESIDGNFNVAAQGKRQPGSTFKPFAYITAFKEGYTPETIVFDVPTEFSSNNDRCPAEVNFLNKDTACFHPQNFDGIFRGPVPLKQALAQSINVPSVKVLYLAGLDETITTAQKFGISTLTDRSRYGLSLVLGGGEVKLVDLVGAYSVFAQDGIKHSQSLILKVENYKGNVLEEYRDKPLQIIEPQYTRIISDILSDINLRSGLFQASLPLTVFESYEVALKTGTTNDYKDAWAIGYTPFLTVGVWAGRTDNKPMEKQGGSVLAAIPMWSSFLKEIINNYPAETFIKPEIVASQRPMLSGQYINNTGNGPQVHNVLYYLNKKTPLQESTQPDPGNDPQFSNWEYSVLEWAKKNIPGFSEQYNK